jgi:hypothetical protein
MSEPSTSEKLVNNVALTLFARGAMVIGGIAGPIAVWMMSHAVDVVDKIGNKVDTIREQSVETNGNVKLIQQTQVMQTQVLADHEARMRFLENFNRKPSPP